MCKRNGEFVNYLLLHCEIVCTPWNVFFCCFGLCLDELSTCLLVAGLLFALGVLLCRRWCPIVFCDVFERKEMIRVLRNVRRCWRSLRRFSSILYLWTTAIISPLDLSFHDFLAILSHFS
jgi:hypothetical protein